MLVDAITAGRVAHGERWSAARIDSTLTIAIGGEPRLRDRVVLDGDAASRMRRFEALATCVMVGRRVAACAQVQLGRLGPAASGSAVVVAGSAFGDGAVFRIAGERVDLVTAAARALLGDACAQLGEQPWRRRW